MSELTRPRAFPPTPELATDAEISGLFRMLDEPGRLDSNHTPHRDVECTTPAAVDVGHDSPCPRSSTPPASSFALRAAFARWASAVACKLNQ